MFYKLSLSDGTGSTGAAGRSIFSAQQKRVSGCVLEETPRPSAGEAHERLVSSSNGNTEVPVSCRSQKASELKASFTK